MLSNLVLMATLDDFATLCNLTNSTGFSGFWVVFGFELMQLCLLIYEQLANPQDGQQLTLINDHPMMRIGSRHGNRY